MCGRAGEPRLHREPSKKGVGEHYPQHPCLEKLEKGVKRGSKRQKPGLMNCRIQRFISTPRLGTIGYAPKFGTIGSWSTLLGLCPGFGARLQCKAHKHSLVLLVKARRATSAVRHVGRFLGLLASVKLHKPKNDLNEL